MQRQENKMMTRKDYIATAKIFNSYAEAGQDNLLISSLVKSMVEDFADLFANDNPNFDEQRFLDAVGV
jgi:hypothetical protein